MIPYMRDQSLPSPWKQSYLALETAGDTGGTHWCVHQGHFAAQHLQTHPVQPVSPKNAPAVQTLQIQTWHTVETCLPAPDSPSLYTSISDCLALRIREE